MTQINTATVETLTAEVRVLTLGSRQVTLSVAKQLDRVDCWGDYGLQAITPFVRVKTGVKSDDSCRDEEGNWVERPVVPMLEVIGRSNREEDSGALIIFEVASGRDIHAGMDKEEKAILEEWKNLPLIVLAGLK